MHTEFYSRGLEASVWIIASTSCLLFVFIILSTIWSGREERTTALVVSSFLFSVFVGIGMFVPTFATLNTIALLPAVTAEAVTNELKSGILALRLSSLLLGWQLVQFVKQIAIDRGETLYHELEISYLRTQEERTPPTLLLMQFTLQLIVYLFSVTVLWLCVIEGVSDFLTLTLNWAVFFVVDDWKIICDYTILLKGRALLSHRRRITFFNALLALLVIGILMAQLNWFLAIGLSFLIVALVLGVTAASSKKTIENFELSP